MMGGFMSEKTIDNIKNYLKTVEEEQKQIEEKEKMLSDDVVAKKDTIEEKKEILVETEDKPEEKPVEVPDKDDAIKATVEKKDDNFDWSSPLEEVRDDESFDKVNFVQDLLEKTESVLKKYSVAYISQNIENSQMMLEFLEKTALLLPYNTDFELRGKIEKNIEKFSKNVFSVDNSHKKMESKKVLEEFLYDLDKALRRYSRLQIEKDSKRAQYDYNLLLERKEKLPRGNPTYEMVVTKRLGEFENRINHVTKEVNVKKECEVIELHIMNFLKRADKESFDTLYREYRQLIEEYRLLEEKLDKTEISSVKNSLYRCKEKLEKIKNRNQKETRKKHVKEEQKKKEEYLGMRTFWKEYVNDLKLFTEGLNTASSSQYFSMYDKYSNMLDVFYNLVRNDMISKEESMQATKILEYIEGELEALRQGI